ncbi:pentapeptide repeat-containing protein [Actinomadura rubrobrunea]|nr:pentapeptide repeat-containing protein [Actinomadura rubrobrunea]
MKSGRSLRGWLSNMTFVVLVLLVGTGVVLLLWRGPWWFDGKYLKGVDNQSTVGPLIASFRHAVTQLLLGLGGVVALWFTWRNYRLSRRGQVTDRFIKALERLGSSEMYVRYGGVLALEQIVQDAPDQATHATQVLVAFVRDRAPDCRSSDEASRERRQSLSDEPEADVQAALTALTRTASRRHVDRIAAPLDLSYRYLAGARLDNADMRDAVLEGAKLSGASLWYADLRDATLDDADLSGADLEGANLIDAVLLGVNLSNAVLVEAILIEARLISADLRNAKLMNAILGGAMLARAKLCGANLRGADLSNAFMEFADLSNANLQNVDLRESWLESACLRHANLKGANLRSSSLEDTDLTGANLKDADLSRVRWLTVKQVVAARPGVTTKLPSEVASDPRVVERIKQVEGEQ